METPIFTKKPVTTTPPAPLAPTTLPPFTTETEPSTFGFGKIFLFIIFSGATIVILLKVKPEIRKKEVPGMPLDYVESIKEVPEVEAKVIEVEEPVIVEEVEESEEIQIVEPEVLEAESLEEPVEEVEEIVEEQVIEEVMIEEPIVEEPVEVPEVVEISKAEPEEPFVEEIVEEEPEIVEEVPKASEESIEVDLETLGLLKIIKDIGDATDRVALGLLFRQFLKQDPKTTMQDVRTHLEEAEALGLVKKEFLKNKDGVIEINYSLTSKGQDCLNTAS